MVVFPLFAFLVSAACAIVIGYDTWRRPKPDRIVWTIAFGIFAIAAGAEVVGSLTEWTEPLVRVYYLTGAVLVVGYLALGEGYLLAAHRIGKWAPGLTILVTALAAIGSTRTSLAADPSLGRLWRGLDAEAPEAVLAAALRAWASWHRTPPVLQRGDTVAIAARDLLLFYRNRTAHIST